MQIDFINSDHRTKLHIDLTISIDVTNPTANRFIYSKANMQIDFLIRITGQNCTSTSPFRSNTFWRASAANQVSFLRLKWALFAATASRMSFTHCSRQGFRFRLPSPRSHAPLLHSTICNLQFAAIILPRILHQHSTECEEELWLQQLHIICSHTPTLHIICSRKLDFAKPTTPHHMQP